MNDSWIGPLAGVECRRALTRWWVLPLRAVAVVAGAGPVFVFLWSWWFAQKFSPGYRPSAAQQLTLLTVEWALIAIALVLSPALLAGSLAGEKARNTLALLLTCRVSSREIVTGRLAGGLVVVGMLFLGALPAQIYLAGLGGLTHSGLLLLILLPLAVALGNSGLALGTSAIARRGRDALLAVYLVDLLLLLAPLPASHLSFGGLPWMEALNPFDAANPLATSEETDLAVRCIGIWVLLGLAGYALAAWRLRPAYLHEMDRPQRRGWGPGRRVPPVSNRPLLWKELYIERSQPLNRFVRWLIVLIVTLFCGASVLLACLVAWGRFVQPDFEWSDWANAELGILAEGSWPMAWLIQGALGLRAAVTISSERERSTWDALLTSPLEGREFVVGKILGSLYALRGLVAAVIIAWTASALCGALPLEQYVRLVGDTLIVGVFTVAVGFYAALRSTTATRAMTMTVIGWLTAAAAFAVLAFLIVMTTGLFLFTVWTMWEAVLGDLVPALKRGPPFAGWFSPAYLGVRWLLYLTTALRLSFSCWRHFDRLAGRSSFATHRLKRPRAVRTPARSTKA